MDLQVTNIADVKRYSYRGVIALPHMSRGAALIGYLWKKPQDKSRWIFTTSLDRRSFPSGAEFIPFYATLDYAKRSHGHT